jgi:hypothetical protein
MSYPDPADVRAGIVYGESDELEGALDIANLEAVAFDNGATFVINQNAANISEVVSYGSTYGALPVAAILVANGGTYVPPDPAYYLAPAFNGGPGAAPNYGPDGSLTGLLTLPAVAQVLTGISFGASGTQYTGSYNPAASYTNPGIANVKAGTQYTFEGDMLTGTFAYGTAFDAAAALARPGAPDLVTRGKVIENSPTTILARLVDAQGSLLTQANTSSISVKVFDRTSAEQVGATITPVISDTIYNTLQTDSRWTRDATGYNFAMVIGPAYFPAAPTTYRVEAKITPTIGSPFYVLWDLAAENIFSE